MTDASGQRQRAEAVVDTVKAELPPIWLGGRQRMVLVDEIAKALTTTRQEALREGAKVAREFPWEQPSAHADPLCQARCRGNREASSDIAAALDRLASEGGLGC